MTDGSRHREAVIDEQGNVRLPEPVKLPGKRKAIVAILEAEGWAVPDTTLLSEAALAEDWNRPEEDAAWEHWQRER